MSGVIAFTENRVFGGATRYMVDLVNLIARTRPFVRILTNPGGLDSRDLRRIDRLISVETISALSVGRTEYWSAALPRMLRRLVRGGLLLIDPLFFLINLIRFRGMLAISKPSLLLCCNGGYPGASSVLAMAIAGRLAGIAVVLSVVSLPAPRRRITRHLDRWLDRFVWRSVDLVIVNADAIAIALENERSMPKGMSAVVRNGMEDASPSIRRTFRDRTVIGCLARMDREKGVLVLLDAFFRIAEAYPEAILVLAGEGNASDEVRHRVASHPSGAAVELLGRFDGEAASFLQDLDVYAFPSLWEGLPYSIIEAMRGSCAIVASRVGGVAEALEDEREALLVAPASVDELSAALSRLLGDRVLRSRLASAARQRYERDFTIASMHRQALSALRCLTGDATVTEPAVAE